MTSMLRARSTVEYVQGSHDLWQRLVYGRSSGRANLKLDWQSVSTSMIVNGYTIFTPEFDGYRDFSIRAIEIIIYEYESSKLR